MRLLLSFLFLLLTCTLSKGQNINTEWYSESSDNGIIIQNSYPKGGPYPGPTTQHFSHSHLVFFTRVINETDKAFNLKLNFSADSITIPNSPNTYVKLFLPPDTMTMAKRHLFSYGVRDLESLYQATSFARTLQPKEECLFYAVAFFYQTKPNIQGQYRGGNRAQLVLKGQDLFYQMPPQINDLPCGRIIFEK